MPVRGQLVLPALSAPANLAAYLAFPHADLTQDKRTKRKWHGTGVCFRVAETLSSSQYPAEASWVFEHISVQNLGHGTRLRDTCQRIDATRAPNARLLISHKKCISARDQSENATGNCQSQLAPTIKHSSLVKMSRNASDLESLPLEVTSRAQGGLSFGPLGRSLGMRPKPGARTILA